ncbi:DUF1826 domain-containing protein [Pseudomonas benzenivorans]|uniref:DUF1826 domain-containing protein n=1 Tax=Pseudomonas benzenivorans TaxID=556533 RepID=A0ABY5H1X9_9PSED|nr:DUF1826 domain-containing protein [Pseudomonas benzenivorans]UTW05872.1 DUF1826 domain-containing protein [Pseudomonas benzenivorans]
MHALQYRQPPVQVLGEQLEVFTEILREEVNLAIWQRRLPAQIDAFVAQLLAQGHALAQTLIVELATAESPADLSGLLAEYRHIPGQEDCLSDIGWLVSAFACLLGARRIGLRLRVLDRPMCPRFHVDRVPVRLITSYAGPGSQWLAEGAMVRQRLGEPAAEPQDPALINSSLAGHVLLAKGEKWSGNEGAGLIHRSPQPHSGKRRLLLTLDWLG